jgi:hypothetical protein
MPQAPRLFRLLFLALGPLALVASGCGVELNAEQNTTEIFKDVTVSGIQGQTSVIAGQELRIYVEYSQPYPRQLDVDCDLMDASGDSKVADLSVQVLPPNALENIPTAIVKNFKDEVTPTTGTLELAAFAPHTPGSFRINCFTQEDDNNQIERPITIEPVPVQTP